MVYQYTLSHVGSVIQSTVISMITENDLDEYLNFVTHKRIEIDSVLAKVGSKRFWDFLVSRLNEKFPTRNYNRAITIPKHVLPTALEELVDLTAEKVASFLKPQVQKITKELAQIYGFITVDIKVREEEIAKRLKDKIESDKAQVLHKENQRYERGRILNWK